MKLKDSFFYTLRENVKDEDSASGNLLARAGMIKKNSAGVYMYMPLGYKALTNIQNIIRDEMNKTGCQELLMPALIPEDIYISSGRRDSFGSSMFTLNDRFNKPFVLGPTHEELFAMAAQMKIKSYKDMPFSLYQFQTKFRDEPRPRFGLIRVREFIMKDAYTFDVSEEALDVAYQKQFNAYKNAFDRMKIDYTIVKADTGVMGGLLSEEFQAVCDIGEDILVLCDSCDFSSNLEIAECITEGTPSTEKELEKELVHTPNAKTIEEVAGFFGKDSKDFVKTLIYKADDQYVACLVRGDREVNETKVRKLLEVNEIELADADAVVQITNASVGFAGPINLTIPVIMDNEITLMKNFIVGANQTDHHYSNVNLSDFTPAKTADIREIQEGDPCPKCGKKVHFKHGIEIGNTFKLGTKYAKALNLQYLDQNNQLQDVVMGSYGIGPGRCLAALAEQFNDEKGLLLPISVAPYKVAIVVINMKVEEQVSIANDLYNKFMEAGIDTMLDDRDERAGVKFNDMDLVGVPIRITVGKAITEGKVEVKLRTDAESQLVEIDQIEAFVKDIIQKQ